MSYQQLISTLCILFSRWMGPPPHTPPLVSHSGPPTLAHVTVVLLVAASNMAALGTEGGSVFFLDVNTLMLIEGQTLGPDEVLRR